MTLPRHAWAENNKNVRLVVNGSKDILTKKWLDCTVFYIHTYPDAQEGVHLKTLHAARYFTTKCQNSPLLLFVLRRVTSGIPGPKNQLKES